MTLKLKSMCAGQIYCPLMSFEEIISSGVAGAAAPEQWCTGCNNDSADVCLKAKLTALTNASNEVSKCMKATASHGVTAGTFFVA